jgi:hypothetical protein
MRMAEEQPQRGVENPSVIDLITPDPETGEVVLSMLEQREWSDDYARLKQLEDKINAYLVFVLDGFLVSEYPEYEGRPVRIQLDCSQTPPSDSRTESMLIAARNYASSNDVNFAIKRIED